MNLWWMAAATLAALAVSTAIRLVAVRRASADVAAARLASLKTWWVLAIVVLGAALLGHIAAALLLAAMSAVAWWEYVRLAVVIDRRLAIAGYFLIALSYLSIALARADVYVMFLPLTMPMLAGLLLIARGQTEGFVHTLGAVYLGSLLTTYGLGHAALLMILPPSSNTVAGPPGWFLYLVLLTECSDIAQALVGRRLGKRPIAPQVSPRKTWEGFIGGMVVSMLLAALLAPWLTPLSTAAAIMSGLVIALAGFLGDLTVAAVKRDAGVKDSSQLLPGQGGMLDRINSMTLAAPAFYYYLQWTG